MNHDAVILRLLLAAGLLGSCATLDLQAQQPGERELQLMVAEILPRVEALSGLEARAPLNVASRSREELRAFLTADVEAEIASGRLKWGEAAYRRLGLVPDGFDYERVAVAVLSQQIAGYYVPAADTLFLLEDVPPREMRAVVAHEIVHALQDQHFSLDSLRADYGDNDRFMALSAAIEGHATLVMLLFALEDAAGVPVAFDELPDLTRIPLEAVMPGKPSPELASAPRIMRETGAFPYVRGLGFVHALRGRDPEAVPFEALLPASTEQVMDPHGRFVDGADAPTQIRFDNPGDSAAGAEWRPVYENTLGQFELSILLMERHRLQSESLANGWDGDRYQLLYDGERNALVWYIVWDDARASSRFVAAYTQVLRTRMGRTGHVEQLTIEGRPVVRVIEAEEGVDISRLPLPTVQLVDRPGVTEGG